MVETRYSRPSVLISDKSENIGPGFLDGLVKQGMDINLVEEPEKIKGAVESTKADVLIADPESLPLDIYDLSRQIDIPIIINSSKPLSYTEITLEIDRGAHHAMEKSHGPDFLAAYIRAVITPGKRVVFEHNPPEKSEKGAEVLDLAAIEPDFKRFSDEADKKPKVLGLDSDYGHLNVLRFAYSKMSDFLGASTKEEAEDILKSFDADVVFAADRYTIAGKLGNKEVIWYVVTEEPEASEELLARGAKKIIRKPVPDLGAYFLAALKQSEPS